MASPNPLNVYKGPDSVKQYFDPESSPPLPLVEIPDCLNPFREDGVRIYAKMMTMHPANNVKAMPGTGSQLLCFRCFANIPSSQPIAKVRGARTDKDGGRVQLWLDCLVHVIGVPRHPRH